MTLTIELSPAEQARLTDAARRTGLEPAELAKRWVAEHLPASSEAISEGEAGGQTRAATIKASRGSMAHVKVSVEDLHRERQADKEKEERRAREYAP